MSETVSERTRKLLAMQVSTAAENALSAVHENTPLGQECAEHLLRSISLARLTEGFAEVLSQEVEKAQRELVTATFTVDTSEPSWPGDLTEEKGYKASHRGLGEVEVTFRGGEMYINGVRVIEYLSPEQGRGDSIGGEKLEKLRIADTNHPDLPDPILELVLRNRGNPAVAVWLKKYNSRCPCFWGTSYERTIGFRLVRYLYRSTERWEWIDKGFSQDWNSRYPALVLERPLETTV